VVNRIIVIALLFSACGDDSKGTGGTGGSAGAGGNGGSAGSGGTGGSSGTGGAGGNTLPSGALTRYSGNPLLLNGPETYDYWKTGPRAILKEGPTTYRMWYEAVGSDGFTRAAYATSTDGMTWTKQGVVMSPDQTWEAQEVSPNSILLENGVYKLWYHGGGYAGSGGQRLGNGQIGYATSADGLTWTKYSGNPVVRIGGAGTIDEQQCAEPRVYVVGGNYRMYYTAQSVTNAKSLAMATSTDGMTWTKFASNPLLPAARWGGWGGAFIFDGSRWNLWHATMDDTSGLVYMHSDDGITNWIDGPSNPVLTPSGNTATADAQAVGDSVSGYRDGNTYRIMYSGFNSSFNGARFEGICLATIAAGP
jgi:hypothetical protein